MREHSSAENRQTTVRGGVSRAWEAVSAQGLRLGRALLSSAGVVAVLRVMIVLELCVLGVGVVRRLEDSYDRAMEVARMELAVLEAEELVREEPSGSAAIGVAMPTQDEAATGGDDAPALRARDVATIISEETGDFDAAATVMEGEAEGSDGAAVAAVLEGPALSEEDDEEFDLLIRQGVKALTAGDMRLCILSLEQASTLAPNHPALLYYYGLAYDKLLNPRKARDYYNRLFHMRDKAGKYFDRASRRLTYGVEQPSALRGKLAFGPHKVQHTYDAEQGEHVSLLLPIMLAPGEEIRPEEIYVKVQFFDIINGRKVDFSREEPKPAWANEEQSWENFQEDIIVTYEVPPLADTESFSGSDVKFYGFTAKLYYKGEPLDCISSPSALILHEQMLNNRQRSRGYAPGLLPDDGLSPFSEEAVPYSQEYDETPPDFL